MPRVIPSAAPDENEVGDGLHADRGDEVRYGAGEIKADEIAAIARAYEGPVTCFEAQFTTHSLSLDVNALAASYTAAHDWLSEHATGPWLWEEHETNHGHSRDISVYIERFHDQDAFADRFPDLFTYRFPEASALARLAVFRGALPLLSAKESFGVWQRENRGFELLHADDLGERGVRVAITHPQIEAAFLARFGHVFRLEEPSDRKAYVASDVRRHSQDCPRLWLEKNAAHTGLCATSDKENGYRYVIQVRLRDVAEALKRDWGHIFAVDATGIEFSTPDYPTTPDRAAPSDFLTYLKGVAETYEAPHLPEALRAWRHEPASPRPAL